MIPTGSSPSSPRTITSPTTPPSAARRIEAASAAGQGRIVTLGVKPTEPSSAYGYIKPEGPGLTPWSPSTRSPSPRAARTFIEAGYLWNSGNFIVSADDPDRRAGAHAPAVLDAASPPSRPPPARRRSVLTLGEGFRSAPKISIDYAVMEPTQRASVLEVDFAWSDLGAWDAIAASGEGGVGIHIFEDAERILARAPDGKLVAALGVSDLAIIVEDDAVLVCDLSRSQEVKRLVERMKIISPRHLDFPKPAPEALEAGARRFADWLRLRALPIWSTLGSRRRRRLQRIPDPGRTGPGGPRRARVQTRQIFVYAQAGALGWKGRGSRSSPAALAGCAPPICALTARRAPCWAPTGASIDETAMLYDQAFVLFALAAAKQAGIEDPDLEADAVKLREQLLPRPCPTAPCWRPATTRFSPTPTCICSRPAWPGKR
jgi:mannose-1-phosphate guanylyltransferase/mannose-6-phosphate isomerase